MDLERQHLIEKLFHQARLLTESERDIFLAHACAGDTELRREVESLLEHDIPTPISAEDMPTSSVLDKSASKQRDEERSLVAGTEIGPYKILDYLGGGGMGEVYRAEQVKPVRRRVALKLIRPGMDSKMVLARFDVERESLALMDHPYIARVLDAGVTTPQLGSRPFFVMEHVSGVSITSHCDRHKLSIGERLDLFIKVCEGIQHAHQKGVIHRDLKPGNILIEFHEEEGDAAPKIIDFGVARAVNRVLTEKTLYTEMGQIVGTPEYMSPEQAEMSAQGIDTRTDVYSLGVLLYELLTGALPFDSRALRSVAWGEMQRLIREKEPFKPSTRLQMLVDRDRDKSRSSAAVRSSDPRSLGRTVKGDLDWITMKAMEKSRARRYSSASELAEDIRRHIRNEPVVAGPPSATYRIHKFVIRNKGLVVSLVLIMFSLVVGLGGTSVMWAKASAAEAQATQERNRAQTAREQKEKLAESVAEGTIDLAEALQETERFLESTAVRERLLPILLQFGSMLEDSTSPKLRVLLPLQIGRLKGGRRGGNLGLHDEAEALFRQALAANEATLAENSNDDEARARVPALHLYLADSIRQQERFQEAADQYKMAKQALTRQLSDDTPPTDKQLTLLGALHQALGDMYFEKLGDTDRGRAHYSKMLEAKRSLVAFDPENEGRKRSLSSALLRFAAVESRFANHDTAIDLAAETINIRRELTVSASPENIRAPRDLATALWGTSSVYDAGGLTDTAVTNLEEAVRLVNRLREIDPGNARYHRDRTFIALTLAQMHARDNSAIGALAALEQTIESGEAYISDNESWTDVAQRLMEALELRGKILADQDDEIAARAAYARVLEILDRTANDESVLTRIEPVVGRSAFDLATIPDGGSSNEARQVIDEAMARYSWDSPWLLRARARAQFIAGDIDAARKDIRRAQDALNDRTNTELRDTLRKFIADDSKEYTDA